MAKIKFSEYVKSMEGYNYKGKSKGLTAAKVGEWRLAKDKINGLAQVTPEISLLIWQLAQESADRVKRNLRTNGYGFDQVSKAVQDRKNRLGQGEIPLIAYGDYVEAIEVMPMGPNMWGVGIPADAEHSEDDDSLAMIGLSHEFGLGGQPPRPHWRKEYIVFQAHVTAAVNAWLKFRS